MDSNLSAESILLDQTEPINKWFGTPFSTKVRLT